MKTKITFSLDSIEELKRLVDCLPVDLLAKIEVPRISSVPIDAASASFSDRKIRKTKEQHPSILKDPDTGEIHQLNGHPKKEALKIQMRICENPSCKKAFTPKNIKSRFCSDECIAWHKKDYAHNFWMTHEKGPDGKVKLKASPPPPTTTLKKKD